MNWEWVDILACVAESEISQMAFVAVLIAAICQIWVFRASKGAVCCEHVVYENWLGIRVEEAGIDHFTFIACDELRKYFPALGKNAISARVS